LIAQVIVFTQRPERLWYEGRAAAESAKTLAWRYVVGGDPYPAGAGSDADQQFTERLRSVLHDLRYLAIEPTESTSPQITDAMRRLRQAPLSQRRLLYDAGRLADQQDWYTRKSQWNTRRARHLGILAIVLDGIGIVAATFKAFGALDVDILGIIAAIGGALLAWVQAKQYETLGRAYFVASQEIATIRSGVDRPQDDVTWAVFVEESEKAISREHTLWRAARAV